MTIVYYHAHDTDPDVLCARCLAKLGFVPFYVLTADPSTLCWRAARPTSPAPAGQTAMC